MEGKKVLLLEKATYPRDKTCGDALGGKSLEHVHRLGAYDAVVSDQHYKYTKITMSSANGNEMTISLTGNEFAHNTAGFVVKRALLDNALFEAACKHVTSAGGVVLQDASVIEPIWGSKNSIQDPGKYSGDMRFIKGVRYKHEGVEKEAFADIVIGAEDTIAQLQGLY